MGVILARRSGQIECRLTLAKLPAELLPAQNKQSLLYSIAGWQTISTMHVLQATVNLLGTYDGLVRWCTCGSGRRSDGDLSHFYRGNANIYLRSH
jgi:hypothetical protein